MAKPVSYYGCGKLVLSGDSIVVRDRASDGPPISRTVVLSNIACPKVARRNNTGEYTVDEPFAWQAREFVRSKVVGKDVVYTVDNGELSDRVYGSIYIQEGGKPVPLANLLVAEGLARVRRNVSQAMLDSPKMKELIALEDTAKEAKKGLHSESSEGAPRKICWNVPDLLEFFNDFGKKELRGIVEYVRDGNSMQILLLPIDGDPEGAYYNIMLLLSGIKAPSSKMVDGQRVPEELSDVAQFYVESRLLQREVTVILESTANNNFVGSVLHPNGNIALFLLEAGLAKCVEWNLRSISEKAGGMQKYKEKEQIAQSKRAGIWQSFVPPATAKAQAGKGDKAAANGSAGQSTPTEYTGTVVEIGNGDNIMVRCQDGKIRKFFLSSVRPPRPVAPAEGEKPQQQKQGQFRPLYQVPLMYDAREFLRKRLIGKNVKVLVDYVQPKPEGSNFDDRVCATIIDKGNVAEALVSRGLATVVRYRNPVDARARDYDALLKAEAAAEKRQVGLFDKKSKDSKIHKVLEIGENVKSQPYLHTLKSRDEVRAIVEFVLSVSKYRVELVDVSLVCSISPFGIDIPYARRNANQADPESDAFNNEARQYVHSLIMHRDVKFQMTAINKQGTFIGHIILPSEVKVNLPGGKKKGKKFFSSTNLSEILVAKGYATVNQNATTRQSDQYRKLTEAEEFARSNNLGVWASENFKAKWDEEMNPDQNVVEEQENPHSDGLLFPRELQDESPDEAIIKKAKASRQGTGFMARAVWRDDAQPLEAPNGKNFGVRFFVYKGDAMSKFNTLLAPLNSAGFPGAEAIANFQPRRGLVCAVMSPSKHCWCRGRILRIDDKLVTVHLLDFGYDETVSKSAGQFAALPDSLKSAAPLATEYRLAFVKLPLDTEDRVRTLEILQDTTQNVDLRLTPASKGAPVPCGPDDKRPVPSVIVQVCQNKPGSSQAAGDESEDVAESLLSNGLAFMENIRMPADLCVRYSAAEEDARKRRRGIWRYGDFRDDEE